MQGIKSRDFHKWTWLACGIKSQKTGLRLHSLSKSNRSKVTISRKTYKFNEVEGGPCDHSRLAEYIVKILVDDYYKKRIKQLFLKKGWAFFIES